MPQRRGSGYGGGMLNNPPPIPPNFGTLGVSPGGPQPWNTPESWYQQYGLTMPTTPDYAGGNPHFNADTGKYYGSPGWDQPDPGMSFDVSTGQYAGGWTPPGMGQSLLNRGAVPPPQQPATQTYSPPGLQYQPPPEQLSQVKGSSYGVGKQEETLPGTPPMDTGTGQIGGMGDTGTGQYNAAFWGKLAKILGIAGAIGTIPFGGWGGALLPGLLSGGLIAGGVGSGLIDAFKNGGGGDFDFGGGGSGGMGGLFGNMFNQFTPQFFQNAFNPNPQLGNALQSYFLGAGSQMPSSQWGMPAQGPGWGGGGTPYGNDVQGFPTGGGGDIGEQLMRLMSQSGGGGGWETEGDRDFGEGGPPPSGIPGFDGGQPPSPAPTGGGSTGNIPSAEDFRNWVNGSFASPINWQTMGPGGINEQLWDNYGFMQPRILDTMGSTDQLRDIGDYLGSQGYQNLAPWGVPGGNNMGLTGQSGVESLINPAIQQAIGQGTSPLDQSMQHLFSQGFPGQGALSEQIGTQLGQGGGIQGQTGQALQHLLSAGLPGQGPLSNFLNWGTDPAHLQAMSTGQAGAPNAVGAPGIQGQVESQLGGLIGGAGLSPEYVQAARQRYLEPQMEALKGRLNAQGGGQASLDSPLFQELQRRQERDFMDQLLMQGQDKLGQYMGQGMQLGGQQFGQGMQNAQLGMQGGQQGFGNFLNAYGAIPQGGNPILDIASRFGQQGIGNATDIYRTLAGSGLNLMDLANQRQQGGYNNLLNLYQGSAGTQLPFIQQMMQGGLASNQAANQNLQTYGDLTSQRSQDQLRIQDFMRQMGLDQYGMHSDNIARAMQMFGMNQQQGLGQADIAASILRAALGGEYQRQAAGEANKGSLIASIIGAIPGIYQAFAGG